MELHEFRPGCAVFLKSGSPALSVVHLAEQRQLVWVTWQSGDKQKDTIFPLAALTHVETPVAEEKAEEAPAPVLAPVTTEVAPVAPVAQDAQQAPSDLAGLAAQEAGDK